MKVLLDENIPGKVKYSLNKRHEVRTTQELNWGGKTNGELLRLLTSNKFQVSITMDKNLKYQQDLNKLPVTIFVLDAPDSRPQTVQPYIDKVNQYLKRNLKPKLIEIKIETWYTSCKAS